MHNSHALPSYTSAVKSAVKHFGVNLDIEVKKLKFIDNDYRYSDEWQNLSNLITTAVDVVESGYDAYTFDELLDAVIEYKEFKKVYENRSYDVELL